MPPPSKRLHEAPSLVRRSLPGLRKVGNKQLLGLSRQSTDQPSLRKFSKALPTGPPPDCRSLRSWLAPTAESHLASELPRHLCTLARPTPRRVHAVSDGRVELVAGRNLG